MMETYNIQVTCTALLKVGNILKVIGEHHVTVCQRLESVDSHPDSVVYMNI